MKHVEDQLAACPWLTAGSNAAESTSEDSTAVAALALREPLPPTKVVSPEHARAAAEQSAAMQRSLQRMRAAREYHPIKVCWPTLTPGAAVHRLCVCAVQAQREQLPAFLKRDEIVECVRLHQCVVISGETGVCCAGAHSCGVAASPKRCVTGCGKTTQLPQLIMDDAISRGEGAVVNMVCTQPRRISAIGVAERYGSHPFRSRVCRVPWAGCAAWPRNAWSVWVVRWATRSGWSQRVVRPHGSSSAPPACCCGGCRFAHTVS